MNRNLWNMFEFVLVTERWSKGNFQVCSSGVEQTGFWTCWQIRHRNRVKNKEHLAEKFLLRCDWLENGRRCGKSSCGTIAAKYLTNWACSMDSLCAEVGDEFSSYWVIVTPGMNYICYIELNFLAVPNGTRPRIFSIRPTAVCRHCVKRI